jgi:hypothetical protein
MSLVMIQEEAINQLKKNTQYKEDCWVFEGSNNGHGYGQIRVDNKLYLVHRLSAHLYLGLDLNNENQRALHKPECKYKSCWNPSHLYVGTQQDNIKDSIEAGTFNGWKVSAENRRMAQVCKRGHEFTKENTYVLPNGKRRCKACRKVRNN